MNEPFSSPDVSNKFQYYPSPETNLKKRDTWEMNKVQEHDYIAKSNQIHNNLPFPIP
jgi:hypothetical protein